MFLVCFHLTYHCFLSNAKINLFHNIFFLFPLEIETDNNEEQSINNEHSINNDNNDKHTDKITIAKLLKMPGILINGT